MQHHQVRPVTLVRRVRRAQISQNARELAPRCRQPASCVRLKCSHLCQRNKLLLQLVVAHCLSQTRPLLLRRHATLEINFNASDLRKDLTRQLFRAVSSALMTGLSSDRSATSVMLLNAQHVARRERRPYVRRVFNDDKRQSDVNNINPSQVRFAS